MLSAAARDRIERAGILESGQVAGRRRRSTTARIARRSTLALRVFGSAVVNRTAAGRNDGPRCSATTRARDSARNASSAATPGRDARRTPTAPRPSARRARRSRPPRRTAGCADDAPSRPRRPEPLARELDRVVGAAVQEPLAVVAIDAREVAVPPHVGPARPVRLEIALAGRATTRASCPATACVHTSSPTSPRTGLPVVVEHVDRHAERGAAERARRQRLRRRAATGSTRRPRCRPRC